MATILCPGYSHLTDFNIPRHSRHRLLFPGKPLLVNQLSSTMFSHALLGIATWYPFRYTYDLIHAFNEVPITNKPWLGTFECEIPRTIGKNEDFRKKQVRKLLLRENCAKIISLSKYGVQRAEYWNRDWPLVSEMMKKVEVIHPTVPLRAERPKKHHGQRIRLIFCGRMFAQKGGIVALRLAKLAHEARFPLQVDLISSMEIGWTDVTDRSRYDADFKLLELPNVKLHGELPNKAVLDLLAESDFQLLATLHDTYGFSVLEGFSVGTPAIVTATCALPEIVSHNENGFLLHVDVDDMNEIRWLGVKSNIWERIDAGLRHTDVYWEQQNQTFDQLARQAFDTLQMLMNNPGDYERLSQNAIERISCFHNSEMTSEYIDNLYTRILRQH